MTPPASNSSPPASPRVACYGTVFLVDSTIGAAYFERGIPSDAPQFSSPRLDASFFINCGRFLTGTIENAPNTYVKRVIGTDFQAPKATVFYECSTELCDLLAALTEVRAAEMTQEWHGANGPSKTEPREPNGRTERRLAILTNLAALARQAKAGQTKLMLRVDYRRQR